ncbi:nucleotide exchange factor GrpE [Nostoc sp. FACHB-133]|uniref:nucleotide exchange factor GrpE n=1 Tax=Nostoc sp. FACHB-133 TaxID=2692835 RepID=UPI001682D95E|nr:nucleotide exchange factor GrpE [Nostoc sp. FACHB-133]MBD2521727.1 nucleotide exchange factor GrpE [Nostoc sp. FACHB-133]
MENNHDSINRQRRNAQTHNWEQPLFESDNDLGKESEDSQIEQPKAEKLEDRLAAIDEKVNQLTVLFLEKIQDDTIKADLFDKLYSQLTYYREDFIFKHTIYRIFKDLIRMFDTLEETLKPSILKNLQPEDLISRFRSFHAQILKTLERHDVELIKKGDGMPFDEVIQEAVDARLVDSQSEDQQVLEVLKRGFKYRESILRSEQVVVGRYEREEQ